ncbi:phage baseplate plug protein [Brevibacillus sp. NPDC003359]|uniref:phage baseplate plug family protein n=1 Tax=unclassified Brevibacillus TaxID=2684853 RepID=UPI00369A6751
MEYLDIEKEQVPYRFEIALSGTVFTFEVNYNSEYDFFTVDLERDGEVLATGNKLVYGEPLFSYSADERFPQVEIIPFDEAGITQEVTWATLGETVFLYVFEEEEDNG